ncbi:dienelactone hydrolase family protein [Mangrovimicrobium sediminis]|uniref:Dienelactone hydrolase family protein n=1 Tax=Mangrovimicrobium sediminis TaxID=2562682 RepID=A0A4Z0M8J9_9GAMM|nr:dienelactone hydrolase family protein [Haliea sp. SAOS-164]TGD75698.1 dienelactone hydrolase family protein [Haliea sp. SAOS-164]
MSKPNVSITTPQHTLDAYLATPEGEGPWPGVVIIHDIFGLTPVATGHADWLASEGFMAIAPDLYSWGGTLKCVKATMSDMLKGEGAAFDDIDTVRQWLSDQAGCSGQIGVIGFCMGGGFCLLLASGHDFQASAPNYGMLPKQELEDVLRGACPVIASYAGKDKQLQGAAAKIEAALVSNGVPHDVKEYPEAYHSFMDDHHTLVPRILGKLLALRFNEKDAADARSRISAFFRDHLAA